MFGITKQSALGQLKKHENFKFDDIHSGVIVGVSQADKGILEVRFDVGGVAIPAVYMDTGHIWREGDRVIICFIGGEKRDPCVLGVIAKHTNGDFTHGNEFHDPDFAVDPHGNEAHDPNFRTYS